MDKFRIEVIACTSNPQQVVWAAMHQDYSEDFVWDKRDRFPDEEQAGELIVKHLLSANRGHYGPLEHPQITLNVGYFPHSMMQQIRTHRVGLCLAGDTEVYTKTASGKIKKIKIADLFNRWVYGRSHQPSPKDRDYSQKRIKQLKIYNLNEDTLEFENTTIADIYCNGVKDVYLIETEDGQQIRATLDHQFLTESGWKKVREFDNTTYLVTRKFTGDSPVVSELDNEVWLPVNDLQEKTDEVSNWGTEKDNLSVAKFVKLKSVIYAGKEMTYDIEVASNYHNFLANDLVVHNSFDVQSFRYTGQRIIDVALGKRDIEDVFYLRPSTHYTNRQGKHYFYSEEQRNEDLKWCQDASKLYQKRIEEGCAEEQARSLIPFDTRQHFVLSCNARSLMHLLDLRWKKDAQLEAQKFCELLFVRFEEWMPAVAQWYKESRAKKARLSP